MQLLTPLSLRADLRLPNRLVMAPMTRYRAAEDGTPLSIVADYYAQRSGAGLIVTEGMWPSHAGQSDWRIPGLVTPEHVQGWARVTEQVHRAGGRIVAQLMHGGRQGHPAARIDGSVPRGPSAVPTPWPTRLPDGRKVAPVTPGAMSLGDIQTAVSDHVRAARLAIEAGFDGVELHGANSYLIHQFLADNTNLRTDAYGPGAPAGRIRFAVEVLEAVAEAIGADRTALRLSPGNPQFGMSETEPGPIYRDLVRALEPLGLMYLHLIETAAYPALTELRPLWRGPLIANVGENRPPTDAEAAEGLLRAGVADAVSLGRRFISNPDLPERIAAGVALADVDERDLYTHGSAGYTDYLRHQELAVAPA